VSVAAASLAIDELAEEIDAENDRRYAYYRMLHATERVLSSLEDLNLAGVGRVPDQLRREIRLALREIPASCMEPFRDRGRVQETLDSVFEVQERLFLRRAGDRPPPEELAEMDDPSRRDRILCALRAAPEGLTTFDLVVRCGGGDETALVRGLILLMAEEGTVRFALDGRPGPGQRPRRYFALEEATGGD